MALVPERFIIDQMTKMIRQEGQGNRAAHRFANLVGNDPIISLRLRELRSRSFDRPRPRQKRHRPRPPLVESSEPYEPYEQPVQPVSKRTRSST